MANIYTNLYQVITDANTYTKLLSNSPLSLGDFQVLAQNRWTWIVTNWSSFSESFMEISNGDEVLLRKFEDFERFINSYKLGNTTNPLNQINNFLNVQPFLDLILLSSLSLSPDELIYKNQEIERIQKLDIEDFQNMQRFLRYDAADRAQIIGLGDEDAAKLLGLQTKAKQRSATIADLEDIDQINETHAFIDSLIYFLKESQKRPPNVLALTKQTINPASKITFDDTFVSYVPKLFEISLEHMALKYMGDQQYWLELVTVNNLQPPYIDLVGEKFPLLAPAASNNLIISDSRKSDVPVGTKIGIGSHRYREETRIVDRVIANDNGTLILFLSGNQDINRFKPSEGGFVRIYQPGTTRPGQFILIPSRDASEISSSIPTPSRDDLRRLDLALLQFGVDFARDEKNDLSIDAGGNFRLVAGLPAVKQAALNALKTIRGDLPFHPNYGVTVDIGSRFFGSTNEAVIFGQLLRESLLQDGRYRAVEIAKVSTTGTGIAVSLLITIAGSTQPLPLSFIS
jgi:hypothetical protein